MTICKTLARRPVGDREITAEERIDTYSGAAYYYIVVAENGIASRIIPTERAAWRQAFRGVIPTARTTYRRSFGSAE